VSGCGDSNAEVEEMEHYKNSSYISLKMLSPIFKIKSRT